MDGPVISKCHAVARQQDVDLTQCLSDVMTAREKGLTVPVILMGYSHALVRSSSLAGEDFYAHRSWRRTDGR